MACLRPRTKGGHTIKLYVYFIAFTGVNLLMQPVNGNFLARLEAKINDPAQIATLTQSIKQNMKLRDVTLIGLNLLDEVEAERGDIRKGKN